MLLKIEQNNRGTSERMLSSNISKFSPQLYLPLEHILLPAHTEHTAACKNGYVLYIYNKSMKQTGKNFKVEKIFVQSLIIGIGT